AALLLNLRDESGQGVIELIPATGLASLEQLAQAIDMSPDALAAVWNDLPLEDAAIASQLGITRQQVINLRKSARARLLRRTAGNTARISSSGKTRFSKTGFSGAITRLFRGRE